MLHSRSASRHSCGRTRAARGGNSARPVRHKCWLTRRRKHDRGSGPRLPCEPIARPRAGSRSNARSAVQPYEQSPVGKKRTREYAESPASKKRARECAQSPAGEKCARNYVPRHRRSHLCCVLVTCERQAFALTCIYIYISMGAHSLIRTPDQFIGI